MREQCRLPPDPGRTPGPDHGPRGQRRARRSGVQPALDVGRATGRVAAAPGVRSPLGPLVALPAAPRSRCQPARRFVRGRRPDPGGRPGRPGPEIPHVRTTTVQRLERLGDRVVVDVADAVDEEQVGAEFGSGRPWIRSGSGRCRGCRIRPARPPARPARCRCARPPTCDRHQYGPAAARAARPERSGCGRWIRRRHRRPGPPSPNGRRPAARSPRRRPGLRPPAGPRRRWSTPAAVRRRAGWRRSHRRTCAAATGKAASVRTSAAARLGFDDDAERHVQRCLGEHLQRRTDGQAVQGGRSPIRRSSSRSARMRSSATPSRTASSAAACSPSATAARPPASVRDQAGGRHLQQSRLGEGPFGTEVSDAGHAATLMARDPDRALRHIRDLS